MYPLHGDTGVCLDSVGWEDVRPDGFARALVCMLQRPELEGVSYVEECAATCADATATRYALPRPADVIEQVTCSPGMQHTRLVFHTHAGNVTVPFTPGEKLDIPAVALHTTAEVWADPMPEPHSLYARCAVLNHEKRREVALGTTWWRGHPVIGGQLIRGPGPTTENRVRGSPRTAKKVPDSVGSA